MVDCAFLITRKKKRRFLTCLHLFIHIRIYSVMTSTWFQDPDGIWWGAVPSGSPSVLKVWIWLYLVHQPRADSCFAPSQWETSLQSNAVSHWLGTNLESTLPSFLGKSGSGFIWFTIRSWKFGSSCIFATGVLFLLIKQGSNSSRSSDEYMLQHTWPSMVINSDNGLLTSRPNHYLNGW